MMASRELGGREYTRCFLSRRQLPFLPRKETIHNPSEEERRRGALTPHQQQKHLWGKAIDVKEKGKKRPQWLAKNPAELA